MSAFALYVIGFILLVAGVLVGLNLLGVSAQWLLVTALVLAGLGVVTGVASTKRKDLPEAD